METIVRYKRITDCSDMDLTGLVSPERIEKAKKFKHKEDFNRSICAEILFNEMAKDVFPGIETPLKFSYSEKGKPCCCKRDVSLINFSLSHSGDFAACIISDKNCGVDIERIREKDITNLANRVLTPAESKKITAREFYETWTVKESVLKALGTGLSLDMRLISVERSGSKVTAEVYALDVISALKSDKHAAPEDICTLKGEILPAPEGYCLSYMELQ